MFEPPSLASPDGTVTFTAIENGVLIPRCSSCHAWTYSALVSVPVADYPPFTFVVPGNPDDSYMYMKLAGDPRIQGQRMPYGGPYLDDATLQAIRVWIQDGAQNN